MNQWWLVYRRINGSLGLNELKLQWKANQFVHHIFLCISDSDKIKEADKLLLHNKHIILKSLTYCGHIVTYILINIVSGNGLLPEHMNPLLEPMLAYYQGCLETITYTNLTIYAQDTYPLYDFKMMKFTTVVSRINKSNKYYSGQVMRMAAHCTLVNSFSPSDAYMHQWSNQLWFR